MKHLSCGHEDRPNQQENSDKFCNGKRHTLLSFTEIQRKLREQHDQGSQYWKSVNGTNRR